MCYFSHSPRSTRMNSIGNKNCIQNEMTHDRKQNYEFIFKFTNWKEKKKIQIQFINFFSSFLRRRINRWWRRKTCSTLYPNTPVKVKFSVSQDQPTAVNLIVSVSSRFRLFFLSLSLDFFSRTLNLSQSFNIKDAARAHTFDKIENEVNIEWIRILSLLTFSIGFGLFASTGFGCVSANDFIH